MQSSEFCWVDLRKSWKFNSVPEGLKKKAAQFFKTGQKFAKAVFYFKSIILTELIKNEKDKQQSK